MSIKFYRKWIGLLVLTVLLAGCGQKGSLFLVEPISTVPPVAPVDDENQQPAPKAEENSSDKSDISAEKRKPADHKEIQQ